MLPQPLSHDEVLGLSDAIWKGFRFAEIVHPIHLHPKGTNVQIVLVDHPETVGVAPRASAMHGHTTLASVQGSISA